MKQYEFFILFIFFYLFGIIFFELFYSGRFFILFLIFFGFYILLFLYFGRALLRHYFIVLLLFFIAIYLVFFRSYYFFEFSENSITNFEGNYDFYGCVVREPDRRVDKAKYVVELDYLFDGDFKKEVDGVVLINVDLYPRIFYGDCLNFSGKLYKPEAFEGFSYDKYLERYGIYMVVDVFDFEIVEEKYSKLFFSKFFNFIYNFKFNFEKRLNEIYFEPYSGFMAGLLIGSRKGISDDLMENFNITGLTHIIAISGYNITLLIIIVASFLSFLSRKTRVFVSLGIILIFVILVGASAAVVRAGIMGSISLFAIYFGRKYFVTIALFVSAFLMNLINPKILLYDVGFQLSFLATAGLLFVSPLLEKYFLFLPSKFEIRESVMLTVSAQILALPVILMSFSSFSVVSPLANLFVLPFLPLSMLFGFLGVFLSFFFYKFSFIFSYFGFLFLKIIIFFVDLCAKIPFARWEFFSVSVYFIPLYYFFVLWKIINFYKRKNLSS